MATQPATSTSTVIQRLWTQEEYRRLPEGPPYYELEDGRLIEWPLRSRRHQTIVGKLTAALSRYLDRHLLGEVWFGVAVELTPARTYIPDLSFLLTENLGRFADDIAIAGPPDLVVEVTSPSTASRDKAQKLRAYHRAGVPWYWLVEAESLLVAEYRYTPDGYLVNQIVSPDDVFNPALFPGLALPLAELVGAPPEETTTDSADSPTSAEQNL